MQLALEMEGKSTSISGMDKACLSLSWRDTTLAGPTVSGFFQPSEVSANEAGERTSIARTTRPLAGESCVGVHRCHCCMVCGLNHPSVHKPWHLCTYTRSTMIISVPVNVTPWISRGYMRVLHTEIFFLLNNLLTA